MDRRAYIQHSLIEAHRQVCPLELVQCPFSEAGSGDTLRKDLDAYIASDTQQHLVLVMLTMTATKKHLAETLTSTQQDLVQNKKLLAATQQDLTKATETATKMQQNFKTTVSRVTRELESISCISENIEIDSIKTTMVLTTTMLETDTKYCLRMTCDQSDSFFVKPGYKMNIRYKNSPYVSYMPSVHMFLESGENDDQLRWPMLGMIFTIEAPDKKKIADIMICTSCNGQNLNPVLGGVYHQREISFTDIVSLCTNPTHLYITFEYHFCM